MRNYEIHPFYIEKVEEAYPMGQYLMVLYNEIVIPLSEELKRLMRDCRLTSEVDLYNDVCSFKNLFLFSNDNGDQGRELDEQLHELKTKFKAKLKEISGGKMNTPVTICRALYFVSYFDH